MLTNEQMTNELVNQLINITFIWDNQNRTS